MSKVKKAIKEMKEGVIDGFTCVKDDLKRDLETLRRYLKNE